MSRVIIPILVIAIVVLGLGAVMFDRGLERSRLNEELPVNQSPQSGAVYTSGSDVGLDPSY